MYPPDSGQNGARYDQQAVGICIFYLQLVNCSFLAEWLGECFRWLEAIASRLEAIASRLEAIASRLDDMALGVLHILSAKPKHLNSTLPKSNLSAFKPKMFSNFRQVAVYEFVNKQYLYFSGANGLD